MLIPLKELLLTLPVLLLSVCIFGVVGWAATRLMQQRKSAYPAAHVTVSGVFWYLFTGLCLVISIYAIITTRFKTCLLPVPLLVFFLVRTFSKQVPLAYNRYEMKGKQLFIFLLVALFLYWFCFIYCFISLDEKWMKFVSSDIHFYGRVADQINTTGVENTSLDYLGLTPAFHEPYHYGDIWLIAFFRKISGLHPSVAASLCAYPLLAVLFTCGLTSCIISCLRQPLSKQQQIVLIASLLTNGLVFLYPSFLTKVDTYSYSLIVFPKLLIPAVLLTALIQSVQERLAGKMVLIATMAAFLYTPIAPAIAISCVVILGIWLYTNKETRKSYVSLLIAAACMVYLFWFYHSDDLNNYYNFSNPEINGKTMFAIIAGLPLQLVPIIPFMILGYFGFQKAVAQEKIASKVSGQLVWMLFLFFITGLICSAVLYPLTVESIQFFTNIVLPVFSIFIAFSFVIMLTLKPAFLHGIVFILLAFSMSFNKAGIYWVHRMKRTDLSLTKEFLKKHEPGNFVTLKSTKELSGFIGINTEYDLPLLYIDYLEKPYINITLNTSALIPDSSNIYRLEEKTILERSSYSQYAARNRNKIPEKEMMLSFLQRYNMSYFCVSPDTTLPGIIRELAIDSIRLENRWNIYRITP